MNFYDVSEEIPFLSIIWSTTGTGKVQVYIVRSNKYMNTGIFILF